MRQSYDLFTYPPQWFPKSLYLGNFGTVLHQTSYLRWGLNTFIFATSVTLITLVIDTLAGYAFARLQFPGRALLFALVLSTLMIPTAAIVAPLYIIISHFPGWTHAGVNTYPGMVLPMVCSPLGVFMMRQFMSTLPNGLVEAARLDGASEFQIFRKIVLPLMKPAIVVLGIFTFMFQWVNFLWPLVITTTDSMKTLTVGVASLPGAVRDELGDHLRRCGDDDGPDHHRLPDLPALVRPGVDGGRAQAVNDCSRRDRQGEQWQRS